MLYTEISQKIQDDDILIYHQLYFYKNETSKKEIDVIIQQDGKVVPIEVKSGNTRANSLKSLMRKNKDICLGYKFVDGNIGVSKDGIITLPLYMIVFILKNHCFYRRRSCGDGDFFVRKSTAFRFLFYSFLQFFSIAVISSAVYSTISVLVTCFICCFFRRIYTNSRKIV